MVGLPLTWPVSHVAGGAEAFEQWTSRALWWLEWSHHIALDDESNEALAVSQKLDGVVVRSRSHVDSVNLKEETKDGEAP